MQNDEVASILQETADLLELTGGNPYRARAFSRAARSLKGMDRPAAERLRDGSLTEVSGIGDGMAAHVADIVEGGSFDLRDELLSAVPPGLTQVLEVKGLGTKRTRRLWMELDITSLDELEAAAQSDRISTLDGFGAKTQQKILENARQLRRYEAQWRLPDAWSASEQVLEGLREIDTVRHAERTGPLRRRAETMERADVLVGTSHPEAVFDWAESNMTNVAPPENDYLDGTLPDGTPIRIHLASPDRYGTALWETTGSESHRAAFEATYDPPDDHEREEALFQAAGVDVIPPELREGTDEVDAAGRGDLPSLLSLDDLQGCLHNHSTYSDGSATIREMANATRSRGLSYFGLCDHSQSLRIADGLSPEEVREQRAEVGRLNEEFSTDDGSPFRIFHGIESDILADGSLDYESEILETFDFVVASIHTGFSMTEDEATERLLAAIENAYTRILGHPTGRLLLRREGYPIDHERVIEGCAAHDVAIELNANPFRLDLDWRWVRTATQKGVPIAINPDAHAVREIDNMKWGVAVARKGWLTADDCLNAKPLGAFEDWLHQGRR